MTIHRQRVFDVFANIVSDGSEKDRRHNGTTTAPETVKCLPSIIPFDLIVSALNTVDVVPSSSVNDEEMDCSDGMLLQMSMPFGGVDFKLCALTAFGGGGDDGVEYLGSLIRRIEATMDRVTLFED
ncbi:uncharacterized protein IUM83_09999 [Phytophthora cinnamomi]|uniref:uncharacterized protein n=1 Tax=Phytophthora cinnamomi TaxID=4785 RepID=UPI003559BA64|nr:hypothetical protein IUM83_09999 [Phytophthora cinnamomi]